MKSSMEGPRIQTDLGIQVEENHMREEWEPEQNAVQTFGCAEEVRLVLTKPLPHHAWKSKAKKEHVQNAHQ